MLIKRVLFVLFFISVLPFYALSAPFCDVSGESAILIKGDTNEVIFEKNSSAKMSMASTTKIMTAIIAVESGKMDDIVKADKNSTVEGTAIGIKKGDSFTLETLVYAALLESGNDAAELIAEYLCGTEEAFAQLMNRKAREIGMMSTNFVTASGLDAKEHYTTAYDMALLGAYAVKNPEFRKICSTKTYKAEYISPQISATYSNHNKLLSTYKGVIGIKTGYTRKSGRCLVSACENEGALLVAVTLKAPDDWNDHIRMYNYGYEQLKKIDISDLEPEKIRIYSSDKKQISVSLQKNEISVLEDNCRIRIILPDIIYAPIKKNEIVGYLEITDGEKPVGRIPILAMENADSENSTDNKPQYGFWYKLRYIFKT